MPLSASITVNVAAHYTGANDLGTVAFDTDPTKQAVIALATGTGSGQADLIFSDTRTIAASSSENLDLAGVLTDPLGATLTIVKLKAIYVRAAAGNTNDVQIGGGASNAPTGLFGTATDYINVKPGGVFLWVAPNTGVTVTGGTGDILKAANSSSGTGVTYDIIIIGTSA